MTSIESIGHTAGTIWSFLRSQGPAALSAVEHGVGAPRTEVAMALGWLAREGKLRIETEGRATRFAITD